MSKQQKSDPSRPIPDRMRDLARYSGMAFQIGFIILLGALAGKKLDAYFALQRPIFTLVCSLFAVFAALYLSLKDFIGNPKKANGPKRERKDQH